MRMFNREIAIVTFPTARGSSSPEIRARQLSHFMDKVQRRYVAELGLTRIPKIPLPLDDPEDILRRTEQLRHAGMRVEQSGLQFIGAFAMTGYGKVSADKNAIHGLLVLSKESLCSRHTGHQPTEIAEWETLGDMPGLDRALLREGMQYVHPGDPVIAAVAEPNVHIYDQYGFTKDTPPPTTRHSIFDTDQIRLQTTAADLRQRLGDIAASGH